MASMGSIALAIGNWLDSGNRRSPSARNRSGSLEVLADEMRDQEVAPLRSSHLGVRDASVRSALRAITASVEYPASVMTVQATISSFSVEIAKPARRCVQQR